MGKKRDSRSLADIYGLPQTPQREAEYEAVVRVCRDLPENIQSLGILIIHLENGVNFMAHRIDGECQGESTHVKAYGMMIDMLEYLVSAGISREDFEAASAAMDACRLAVEAAG